MSGANEMIMTSLLNNINQVNLNNRSMNNKNTNSQSGVFDTILKNSLGQSSCGCECNDRGNELSMLSTMVGILNSIKISTESVANNKNTSIDENISNVIQDLKSVNNTTTDKEITSSTKMDKALKLIERQIGKPYVWGADGPSSFDCSGFTSYIYKEALGKNIPRTSYSQSNFGQTVDKKNLQPGDLVFFDTMKKGRVSHVGIYIGDGEFIHASNARDGVKKSSLSSSYYEKAYKGARRP